MNVLDFTNVNEDLSENSYFSDSMTWPGNISELDSITNPELFTDTPTNFNFDQTLFPFDKVTFEPEHYVLPEHLEQPPINTQSKLTVSPSKMDYAPGKEKNFPAPSSPLSAIVKEQPLLFTCTWFGCKTKNSFTRKSDFTKHMERHTRPYSCHIPSCSDVDFSDKGGLLRHQREKHGNAQFFCRIPSCTRNQRGFNRKRNLDVHMATIHQSADSAAGEAPMSNDLNGVSEEVNFHEESILNVETVSGSAKPNELWSMVENDAMGGKTEGMGEIGRMEAKLQELELRKRDLADLQAKVDEDIKTLKNALGLLAT